MHKRILFILLALATGGAAASSQTQGISVNADAAAILEAGLSALGGDAIRGTTAIRFVERARSMPHDQSPSPEPPYPAQSVEDTVVVDPYGERLYRHEKGATNEQIFLIDGHAAFVMNPRTQIASPLVAGQPIDSQRRATRRVPAFLVLEAVGRASDSRVLSASTFEGRAHRVVEVPFSDGLVLRLWFDTSTALLTKHERGYVDATLGDVTEETLFTGYRPAGALRMPTGYRSRRNAFVVREVEVSGVEVNPALPATRFRVPAEVKVRASEPPRPLHTPVKLSDRVYVLEQVAGQNANVMFVVQDDGVVVVDAPETRAHTGLSERVIATIRQTIPGRPIKYVVPTHHHADHGAGLRPYIAEGVRVLTTPGNEAFVKRLASAPFTWKPDALARRPRTPMIETLTQKKGLIRSGSHVIELYDVGPEPHAQENIAVWLPAERVLFLGDLFETSYRAEATWDGKGILGDILSRFKWEVDTLVTSHSRPRRMTDLRSGGTS